MCPNGRSDVPGHDSRRIYVRPLFDGTGRWEGILVYHVFIGLFLTLAGRGQMTTLSALPTSGSTARHNDGALLDWSPFVVDIHEVGYGIEGWRICHNLKFPHPTQDIG